MSMDVRLFVGHWSRRWLGVDEIHAPVYDMGFHLQYSVKCVVLEQ